MTAVPPGKLRVSHFGMAYDEALADRVRDLVRPRRGSERKMFGGIAFMVGGNMACCAREAN